MKLYKYRDILDNSDGSRSEKLERLNQILLGNKLWCASPDSLNDKDEFDPKYDCTPNAETETLMQQFLTKYNGEKPRQLAGLMNEPYLKRVAGERFKEINQRSRTEIGLICMSKTNDAAELWKEYGGDGYGLCVEIEFPDEMLGDSLHPVIYVKEKIVHIDLLLKHFLEDELAKRNVYNAILATKTNQWQHENEVRFISKYQRVPLTLKKELGQSITAVTFGDKIQEEMVNQIKTKIDHTLHEHSIKFDRRLV